MFHMTATLIIWGHGSISVLLKLLVICDSLLQDSGRCCLQRSHYLFITIFPPENPGSSELSNLTSWLALWESPQ